MGDSYRDRNFNIEVSDGLDAFSIRKGDRDEWTYLTFMINGEETAGFTFRDRDLLSSFHHSIGLVLRDK